MVGMLTRFDGAVWSVWSVSGACLACGKWFSSWCQPQKPMNICNEHSFYVYLNASMCICVCVKYAFEDPQIKLNGRYLFTYG